MKKQHLKFLLLLVLSFLVYACEQEELGSPEESLEENTVSDLNSVETGEALDIPYTVNNMDKAFKQLLLHLDQKQPYGKSVFARKSTFAAKRSISANIKIVPSHYYYRFLPKDSIQYQSLVSDTIMDVTNIPLHLKTLGQGDVYDDPTIKGDETGKAFGWQYSVLPYNYKFPKHIKHEKLEDLYFAPELDAKETLQTGEMPISVTSNSTTDNLLTVDDNGTVFEYLELEALKLTQNLDEEELAVLRFYLPKDKSGKTYTFQEAKAKGYSMPALILDYDSVLSYLNEEGTSDPKGSPELASRRRKWAPHGRLTVWDNVVNKKLPVRGAHVKVRKWGLLVIRKAHTNSNGEFRTRKTRTKRVKYAVYFENRHKKFRVKAGNIFVNAKHRGTRRYKRKGWYQHFSAHRSRYYAEVHNGTMDFYDRAVGKFGLKHPNSNWIRINAQYNRQAGRYLDLNPNGTIPWIPTLSLNAEIKVGRLRRSTPMQSDRIYALMIHEMTHASHYRLDRSMFINPAGFSCRLKTLMESWAEGVETVVTNDRYLELDRNYQASVRIRNFRPLDLYNSQRQDNVINPGDKEFYTPIVIDLVDNYNQNVGIPNNIPRPRDRVSGYSLRQIQRSLKGARGPHGWKENLIRQHYNPTEQFVNELFDQYMYTNCN
ncbi:MAG: hypothetical protein AAGF77_09380 [Bacteroidota bacterium]